jgi:hypothetical protein
LQNRSPQRSKGKKDQESFSKHNKFAALNHVDREETEVISSPSIGFSNLTVQQVIEEALKSSSKLKYQSKRKGGLKGVGEGFKGRDNPPPIPLVTS